MEKEQTFLAFSTLPPSPVPGSRERGFASGEIFFRIEIERAKERERLGPEEERRLRTSDRGWEEKLLPGRGGQGLPVHE